VNQRLEIKKVAIVGAGTLGAQIAVLAADAGYDVAAFDPDPKAFHKNLEDLRLALQNKGQEPFVPWDRWETCLDRIEQFTDLESTVAHADLVIEAAPENLELKRKVFEELGRMAPPHAILATNSSSLPVSRVEESSGHPERCLNIHFYRPLEGMNMVDVMGGTRTSPDIMDAGIGFVRSLGCIPLTVKKEQVGFCFNRVWRAIKRETLHMWAAGTVDFRDIDRAWMVFTGMKESPPFALMDNVGLDVVYDIEMVYYNESGDPKDHPPRALKDKIEMGELGVKSGRGFYSYPDPEYLRPDFLDPTKK
jgi:3-hydroxybutyryl-CoA dehydrogenase